MANVNDVLGLMASLDAQIGAADAAVHACPAMPTGDLTAWTGFVAQWDAEKVKIHSYTDASWWNLGAKGAEVLEMGTFYSELQGFAEQFKAWQPMLAADCPGYSAPPSPIPPTPPGPAPVDWNSIVRWGAIGALAIAGIYVVKTVKEVLP